MNGDIEALKKSTFVVAEFKDSDAFIAPNGERLWVDKQHHVEVAYDIISRDSKTLKEFQAANKNRGYDSGEFLVIVKGYIAVSEGYLIYHNTLTRQQQTRLEVVLDENVLIPYDVYLKQHKEITKEVNKMVNSKVNDEKQYVLNFRDYYSESKNQFHSPSGIPRMGYTRWQTLARKHGLYSSPSRYCWTS